MKLFSDSAKVSAWALPAGYPPVQGATTNITHFGRDAKSSQTFKT